MCTQAEDGPPRPGPKKRLAVAAHSQRPAPKHSLSERPSPTERACRRRLACSTDNQPDNDITVNKEPLTPARTKTAHATAPLTPPIPDLTDEPTLTTILALTAEPALTKATRTRLPPTRNTLLHTSTRHVTTRLNPLRNTLLRTTTRPVNTRPTERAGGTPHTGARRRLACSTDNQDDNDITEERQSHDNAPCHNEAAGIYSAVAASSTLASPARRTL